MSSSGVFNSVEGIAIIGMTGRFPGAKNIEEFWHNLRDGVESTVFFTDKELEEAGINPAILSDSNYVKAGAILEDIELFDASFFGFSPKEAANMDPQHRIFLECAWEALENAGYNCESYSGRIGTYAGAGWSGYLLYNIAPNWNFLESLTGQQTLIGNDKDFLTTRVSYHLNLKGPSINVQTACSTSLVATNLACQSLLNYQCDMALAGGITISVPQKAGYFYQKGGILSPNAQCRTFDAKAQGTFPGYGVGIVVLKRLEDAIADGDCIHAVIKGSAINNDGSLKIGYTAPSVDGQAEVIAEALALAGIEPETVSYIEAHGTATALGDPIEIAALTQAFRASTEKKGFCAIGSVKTNIGHLDAAAGVAGLIKTVLALKHKQIPPSLNFEQPNPQIDFANSPFYVNTKLTEWRAGSTPRRAGVSSLGIGGTNAHVILEEAPDLVGSSPSRPWQLLVLSTKTDSALETATENLAQHLKQAPDTKLHSKTSPRPPGTPLLAKERDRGEVTPMNATRYELNLANVAHTLQVGRKQFNHRRVVVCQDTEDAISALQMQDSQRVFTHLLEPGERAIAFMFPGQGAQYVDMGKELYQTEPIFKEQVDRCCQILKPHLGLDLHSLIYPNESESKTAAEKLQQTYITQPALFVIEYALAQLWISWGISPSAMIGHSIGEYVAACLAGVISVEDALALVAIRGRLMQQLPAGAMLSVSLPEAEIKNLLNENLSLAAINAPSLCVLSGTHNAVDAIYEQLIASGVECRHLHTSHAFHSQMMEAIIEPFIKEVKKVKLNPPQIPFISNVTGTWITVEQATDPNYWARHLRQTVRFEAGISTLLQEPNRILLEVGPGRTLCTFAKKHSDFLGQCSLRHPQEKQSDVAFLLKSLGKLWLYGVQVNWSGFYAHEHRHRIPLPTYPFERQRYWIEPQKNTRDVKLDEALEEKLDIRDWFYIPSWKRSVLPVSFEPKRIVKKQFWLVFTDDCGIGNQIVEKLKCENKNVINVKIGEQFCQISEWEYSINPQQKNDYNALLKAIGDLGQIPTIIAHLWNITPNEHIPSRLQCFEKAQDIGFYSLLFLAQALGEQNITDSIQIGVVSNNMQQLLDEEELCPEKATIIGPCKVIPEKYSNITCRSIDIQLPQSGTRQWEQLIDYLLTEFTASTPEQVIAYRGNQRWIQYFEPLQIESPIPTARLREKGVYIIIGGLGEIGLVFAEHLAKTVQAKIVLIERSGLPAKAEWEPWLSNHDEQDLLSTKIKKVLLLEELGAEVLVLTADVANFEQMQKAVNQVRDRFGIIHGVIDASGVPGAAFIQLKTTELAASILQPKVKGTLVLDAVLQDVNLDFLVLFSSNTAIAGGLGQVDYCAANAFLDAFAHYNFYQRQIPTVSINWDWWQGNNWADSLMSSVPESQAEFKQMRERYGISFAEGVDAFSRILSTKLPQVVVSTQNLQTVINQFKSCTTPISSEESEQSKPKHLRPILGTAYIAPSSELEKKIANSWQELLGIEQVGINDNFFDLGGHSLLATQFISQLRKDFQVELSVRHIFEAPTVVELALVIEDMILGELEELTEDEAQEIVSKDAWSI
ncbi:hypothetical protein BZZ01_17430 [Nostocales cyanobacterium HT-58-2]|nr:hypothetical protein BZZ01_17430 [Nostocales cyanobacterium HT-58-2]